MPRKPQPANVHIRAKRHSSEDEEHHGNWKMVYADFATAMMAFFLLMWISAVSTDEQRDLLADYFNPAAVSRNNSGADGALDGRSVDTVGAMTSPAARGETAFPVASPPTVSDFGTKDGPADTPDEAVFDMLERDITAAILAAGGRELLDAISFRRNDDGLLIDVIDTAKRPMFRPGRAELTQHAQSVFQIAAVALSRVPNELRLTGHTDAAQFTTRGYDNMDLSVDRARAARTVLLREKLRPDRIARVEGEGDKIAMTALDPQSLHHRRVSIAVLRRPARSLGLISVPAP